MKYTYSRRFVIYTFSFNILLFISLSTFLLGLRALFLAKRIILYLGFILSKSNYIL